MDFKEVTSDTFITVSNYLKFLLNEMSLVPPENIPYGVKLIANDLQDTLSKFSQVCSNSMQPMNEPIDKSQESSNQENGNSDTGVNSLSGNMPVSAISSKSAIDNYSHKDNLTGEKQSLNNYSVKSPVIKTVPHTLSKLYKVRSNSMQPINEPIHNSQESSNQKNENSDTRVNSLSGKMPDSAISSKSASDNFSHKYNLTGEKQSLNNYSVKSPLIKMVPPLLHSKENIFEETQPILSSSSTTIASNIENIPKKKRGKKKNALVNTSEDQNVITSNQPISIQGNNIPGVISSCIPLLKNMKSYFEKEKIKLPAMYCLVCEKIFNSNFDWFGHMNEHELNVFENCGISTCSVCNLTLYGEKSQIKEVMNQPDHIEVDNLYSNQH